ncbi:hypothetical protein BVRB_9g207110 [Beta vulgaris subsp. vulgaris]|nr:hypothetical protein BVRB_9g207110 [Beta vulgaris subsp. vulgaris]
MNVEVNRKQIAKQQKPKRRWRNRCKSWLCSNNE